MLAAWMPSRLDPRADAAVLLLGLKEMAQPPFRLVEDVRDSVCVLGDCELSVAEIAGLHQIDGT